MFIILIALLFCSTEISADAYWLFFGKSATWQAGDAVPREYLSAVAERNISIRTVSRYFNAVSVEYDGAILELEKIPGVTGVKPVAEIRNTGGMDITNETNTITGKIAADSDYGYSFRQLEMMNVPAAHGRGFTGNGVTVGVLDSGFPIEIAESTKNIRVTGRRNFIDGSDDVSGHYHGAYAAALIAGYKYGTYCGPAYNASLLLALTEEVATETRADEDRWVAGVEWCDSLGADIISSSVVYNIFDTEAESYTKSQMDGKTSLVAQAAETAYSRGILVVASAGNEGGNSWGIITTPADAEHTVAVGAITMPDEGEPEAASFSSTGPTADGRIKPDLAAPGVGVVVPSPYFSDQYTTGNGTSLAAPFVTGLCALLMEAHPEWKGHPSAIIEALKNTAHDLGDTGPDNIFGWGLPDCIAAMDYSPVSVNGQYTNPAPEPAPLSLAEPYPNPFNGAVSIEISVAGRTDITVDIFNSAGQRVERLFSGKSSPGVIRLSWDGKKSASGVYFVKASSGRFSVSGKITLVK